MSTRTPRTTNAAAFAAAQTVIPGGVDSPVRAFGSVGGTPRFMERAQAISEAKLAAKVGTRMEVLVDEVDEDGEALASAEASWLCAASRGSPAALANASIRAGTSRAELACRVPQPPA